MAKRTAAWNAKIGAGNRGKVRSPAQRAHLRAKNLGKKQTAATVAKRKAALTGQKRSPAQRANISKSKQGKTHKGTPHTASSRAKLSAARGGVDDETFLKHWGHACVVCNCIKQRKRYFNGGRLRVETPSQYRRRRTCDSKCQAIRQSLVGSALAIGHQNSHPQPPSARVKIGQANSRAIKTPDGIFESGKHAAEYYSISRGAATLRARNQTHGWHYLDEPFQTPKPRADFGKHHLNRAVITPDREFASATLAGIHYGISSVAAAKRARKQTHGWRYKDDMK